MNTIMLAFGVYTFVVGLGGLYLSEVCLRNKDYVACLMFLFMNVPIMIFAAYAIKIMFDFGLI